jgi:hypothetical protein
VFIFIADLKKTLKKHGEQKDTVLPLEMSYLNKNAFISVVGHQPQVEFPLITGNCWWVWAHGSFIYQIVNCVLRLLSSIRLKVQSIIFCTGLLY